MSECLKRIKINKSIQEIDKITRTNENVFLISCSDNPNLLYKKQIITSIQKMNSKLGKTGILHPE